MKGYLCLGAAILLEFFGTTCMKLSNGFEHKIYTGGTLICYVACFYFLAVSNIAYATWGGLGIILAAAVSYFFFHENISTPGMIGIVLIVIGVVLCNFFGAGH